MYIGCAFQILHGWKLDPLNHPLNLQRTVCNAVFASQCVRALQQRAESVFKVSGLIPDTLLPLMVLSLPSPTLTLFSERRRFPSRSIQVFQTREKSKSVSHHRMHTVNCISCFLAYTSYTLHSKHIQTHLTVPQFYANATNCLMIQFYDLYWFKVKLFVTLDMMIILCLIAFIDTH